MALDSIVVGQTRPVWTFEIVETNNDVLPITGATFTGKMRKVGGNSPSKTMTPGNFSITDAAGGAFSYTPVAADVDTAGRWEIQIDMTISGGVYVPESSIVIREHF